MTGKHLRAMLLAMTAASALLTALEAPALAQDGARAGVEEIIVTARKREEAAKDVPVSITTLSAETMSAISAGGADLSVLSARVPSVNVESSFGRTFPRFYIRGLGNTDFDLNASQPVSLVYDGVVYENPVLKGFPVFDIARVEVLRGPQGTLFGRNTPAGIVKFESVKPSEDFSAYVRGGVRLTHDDAAGGEIEAAAGGAVAEGLSLRASILMNYQSDWIDNGRSGENDVFGGYDEIAGRLQLRWQPNANVDALLNLHGRQVDGTAQLFRANVVNRGSNALNRNFVRDRVFYDGGDNQPQDLNSYGATGTVDIDFGGVTLTSVTGVEKLDYFSRGDIDGGFGAVFLPFGGPGTIAFPAESADGVDDLTQWSQELRLASDADGAFSWVGGLYYFSEDVTISSFNYDTLAGGAANGVAVQTQETEAWAVFGSATWKPTEALALTAGVRYSDDSKDWVGRRTQGIFIFPGPRTPTLGPIRRSVGDEAVSWDVSAVYSLTEDANLYARVARGYRAPSIQGRILFGDAVTTANSEFVTSYEAGLKATLFDNLLRADVSVYQYTIEDQQLTAIGGAGNFNQLLNAEEGEGRGVEADLEFAPSEQLRFTAGLAYNETEIKDPRLTVAGCGAPTLICTVRDPLLTGGVARINGNRFPNAPEVTANLTGQFAQPLANGGRLFAFTDWTYKGEVNFFLYDSVEFTEDGFWEGGLRLGYETPDGQTQFAIFGRNILDEEARTGAIDFNNLTGFFNAPRIIGIEVKKSFN